MMPIDERARDQLYGRLEEVLGVDHATVLMEHLSRDGNFATKDDLKALATKDDLRELAATMATKVELESTKHELTAMFRKELSDALATQTRTMVLTSFSAMATSSALAFAAARLV